MPGLAVNPLGALVLDSRGCQETSAKLMIFCQRTSTGAALRTRYVLKRVNLQQIPSRPAINLKEKLRITIHLPKRSLRPTYNFRQMASRVKSPYGKISL